MSGANDRQQTGRALLGALHAHLQRQKSLGVTEVPASVAGRWAEQLKAIDAAFVSPPLAPASPTAEVRAASAALAAASPREPSAERLSAERTPAPPANVAPPSRRESSIQDPVEVERTPSPAPTRSTPAPVEAGRPRRVERADVPWGPARGGAPAASPPPRAAAAASLTMSSVRELMGECDRCGRCKTRSRILFGAGDQSARLVFVLDPPDAQDDHVGHLLTGDAGGLFDSMLEKGMGLSREQVYVTPVVKCFSGSAKGAAQDELTSCAPFLQDQLRVVGPAAIVALGASASVGLLGQRFDLRNAHGQWAQWKGVPVMPTFSLAAMLEQPALKRQVWKALKQVMERLDLPRPDDATP